MNGKKLLADFKFYSGNYSKYLHDLKRYETWDESVERVMAMHRLKFKDKIKELEPYLQEVEEAYKEKLFLGSQRALQFGFATEEHGIMKHNSRMYNCLTSYADRPQFFQETMYWLLCGCGVGFRVFPSDIEGYKKLKRRDKGVRTFVVPDSIEGWSDAIGVLVSSYLSPENSQNHEVPFPEYQGYRVDFDLSLIREQGALISGGFKAPGPEGLRKTILKIEKLFESRVNDNQELRTIDIYDIVMHTSDAVLSGGVRRSATICLFHKNDELMLNAKTGNWWITNPQRARSNNSVLLLRGDTTKEEFDALFEKIKEWGEPGFVWTEDYDIIYNPCVEIGMYPKINGKSGWQGCNLTEGNGSKCVNIEQFFRMCRASAIMGTLQAAYTDFDYVEKTSPAKSIFEREALLGVSITGFTTNPDILFDPELLKYGAQLVKQINKEIAKIIGINPAARNTCAKPSGNSAVILETISNVSGEHSMKYFRNIQVNKDEDLARILKETNGAMFEESVWSANGTDWVVSFPIEAKEGSLLKEDLRGINLLEKVKLVQQNWIEPGTDLNLCAHKDARHNVSNTIEVEDGDWDNVRDYIYNNREWFAGVSLLSTTGDKDYAQAPFTSVLSSQEILEKYGSGALFASGLIVDGLHAFGNNLWGACDIALYDTQDEIDDENDSNAVLKHDWIRRFKKFADNYQNGDLKKTSYLLKDVYLNHKWVKITPKLQEVDWQNIETEPSYADVSEFGAVACSGGKCELVW